MKNILFKRLIASFFGTLGFALIFNLNKKYYKHVCILGSLTYLIFYLIYQATNDLFISTLISSMILELFVQILAIKLKTPAITLFVSAIIPLIPGTSLYSVMHAIVFKEKYLIYGKELILYILGISIGSSIINALIYFLKKIRTRHIF